MTNQIDHIVEHFFRKKRLGDVSVYELERFIASHPYFAAGHFLLAKKTQLDQSQDVHEKISTTALYYNNPLWLQWLLDLDHNSSPAQQVHTIVVEETETDDTEEEVINNHDSADNDDQVSFMHTEPNREESEQVSIVVNETHDENEFPSSREVLAENLSNDEHQDTALPSQPDWNNDQSPVAEVETHNIVEPGHSHETIEHSENYEAVRADAETSENFSAPEAANVEQSTLDAEQTGVSQVSTGENQSIEEVPVGDVETEFSIDNDAGEVSDIIENEESKATAAGIERSLSTATLIPAKAEIEKNEITFEPYHTIDYFASQGIKLQQSDLSKDKFGKQLKSFTDWLRSMKRLPQAAVETTMDEATQQSIQKIAEHSFEEKDIVTETMAEVWIKQGNKEKAIDTLQKLSLLNPSKSHYFAAKIEQLNAS